MSQSFAVTTADMLALVQHMAPEARAELDAILMAGDSSALRLGNGHRWALVRGRNDFENDHARPRSRLVVRRVNDVTGFEEVVASP